MTGKPYTTIDVAQYDTIPFSSDAVSQYTNVPARIRKKDYKPVILRTPSLLALLVFTLSLIALLQFALVQLPDVEGRFGLDSLKDAKASIESGLARRQTLDSSSRPQTGDNETSTTGGMLNSSPDPEAGYTEMSSTAKATSTSPAYVPTRSTKDNSEVSATSEATSPSSAYVPIRSTKDNIETSTKNEATRPSEAYVQTLSTKTHSSAFNHPPTSTKTGNVYLPSTDAYVATITTKTPSAASIDQETSKNLATVTPITEYQPEESYVQTKSTKTSSIASDDHLTETIATRSYVPTRSVEISSTTPEDGEISTTAVATSPSSAYVATRSIKAYSTISDDHETLTTAASPSSAYVPTKSTKIYSDNPNDYKTSSTASIAYVQTRSMRTYPSIADDLEISTTAVSAYVLTALTESNQVTTSKVPPMTTSADYVPTMLTDTYTPTTSTPLGGAPFGDFVPTKENKGAVIFTWTPPEVFVSTYLAVLLAVIYRILMSAVQTQLRLIDPFRQLASPKGASASTALFTSYHSQEMLGPLKALLNGRYALSAAGVAFWMSCLLPAFATEAVFVDTNWDCPDLEASGPNPCSPRTTASTAIIRLLQCLLGVLAVVLIGLMLALRRKTGLVEDPSSIAAVGRLMGHPLFEEDVSNLPSGAGTTIAMMKDEMANKRFRLDMWDDQSNIPHYGIIPAGIVEFDAERDTTYQGHQPTTVDWSGTTAKYRPVDPRSSAYKDDGAPGRWRYSDLFLLLLVIGAFGVAIAYYFAEGDSGFNNFFNSGTFGPRFILTGSATVIANLWGSVEQNSMVMAPFNRLAKGSASFEALRFAPTITPILSTWRAVSNGYVFVGIVTIMTLLAEVLSITISGVPFSTGQTWMNFLVVTYISLTILGLMIVAAIAVIVRRKHEPRISIVPDTLGVKLTYLVGSRMMESFDGNAGILGENELRRGRYCFRPVTGREGERWWKVDRVVRQDEK